MSIVAAIILAASGGAAADAAPQSEPRRTPVALQSRASVTVRRAERIDFDTRTTANPERVRVRVQQDGDVYWNYR